MQHVKRVWRLVSDVDTAWGLTTSVPAAVVTAVSTAAMLFEASPWLLVMIVGVIMTVVSFVFGVFLSRRIRHEQEYRDTRSDARAFLAEMDKEEAQETLMKVIRVLQSQDARLRKIEGKD